MGRKRLVIGIAGTALALIIYGFGNSGSRLATLTVEDGTSDYTPAITETVDTQAIEVLEAAAVPKDTTAETEAITEPETAPPETLPETETAETVEPAVTVTSSAPETAASAPVTTAAAPKTAAVTSADKQTDTVYWVKNGEVWHLSPDCSTLSRSKDIESGTVSEAVEAGKERVCKRCGG